MKKFSTLSLGVLFSIASFAAIAPSRLTISAEGNTGIKVTVDGNRFDQQSFDNSVVFDNLQPGYHTVNVYQLNDKRFGIFSRRGGDYRLLYSSNVNIKPLFATTIEINRFGRAQVSDAPMRGAYNDRRWDNDNNRRDGRGYDNDHTYNNNRDHRNNDYSRNGGYGNNGYNHAISDEDFFAAQRVMNRENDNGRLLYGKNLADGNFLTAEQVKDLAGFFSFDNCRLDFVEYAYSKTIDKNNFSIVCNAFSSSDGRNQLMYFLSTCR